MLFRSHPMTGTRKLRVNVLNLSGGLTPDEGSTALRCKFVIVTTKDEISLVFGSLKDYPYHANLVERFCATHNIPSGWEHRPDVYALYVKGVRTHGGGNFVFDHAAMTLRVSGRSSAYGAYNDERLRLVLGESPAFSGWRIDWEGD